MIYKGSDYLNKIMLGANEIGAVYQGSNPLYPFKCENCISMTAESYQSVDADTNLEYSFDKVNWTHFSGPVDFSGKVIYIRGNYNSITRPFEFSNNTSFVSVEGNATYLLDWEYPYEVTDKLPDNAFNQLFAGCVALRSVSADFLPSMALSDSCYEQMFRGCKNLIQAPNLPAKEMAPYCYFQMFDSCGALTNMPALPATTMAEGCYMQMFNYCSGMTVAPALPATTMADYCYQYMFQYCTKLEAAPLLPATTLATGCYQYMFKNCMAITIANLPTTILVDRCYEGMFMYCDHLNQIYVFAESISATNCTMSWVKEVALTGDFYCKQATPWEVDSINGIPEGWTTHYIDSALMFTASEPQSVSLTNLGGNAPVLDYSYDGSNWSAWTDTTSALSFGSTNRTVFLRGMNPSGFCRSAAIRSMFKFGTDAPVMMDGSMMALQNYSAATTSVPECGFIAAFSGSTALRSVAKSVLPATVMARSGCQHTFRACTNLVNSPVIRVGVADASALYAMFYGCTSLVDVPDFPNLYYLAHGSCHLMFSGCKSLKKAPNIPKLKNIETNGLRNAFDGCTALEEGPDVLNCTNVKWRGCEQTFRGCKNLVKAPILNFGKIDGYGMEGMFSGCTKLNEVHCTATGWSDSSSTANWLANVASAGTFYGKPDTPWVIDSPNGVPVGWTWVEKHSIQMTAASAQTVTAPSGSTMEYSYDGKEWTAMTEAVDFGEDDKTVYIRGKNASGLNSQGFVFGTSASTVALAGNIQSLLDWETLPDTVPASGFTQLFSGATAIQSLSSDLLPATNIGNYGYFDMFRGCTGLSSVPSNLLLATTLGTYAYKSMFAYCTNLTSAPSLPAITLGYGCYQNMFWYCNSLTTAPELPSTTISQWCYSGMFNACTALTKAPELPATTLKIGCYSGMFSGCSSLNEIHCSATSISADNCTFNWTFGVASAGDFYGSAEAGWTIGSVDGIPLDWETHLS